MNPSETKEITDPNGGLDNAETFDRSPKKDTFLFSIVMAAFNVSRYIDDALASLESQILDFQRNVQVVIVNDGSTDDSLEKALSWQKKYPKNIVVLDQENQGVSVARNNGLEVATGKYVNFLDPDDMLDKGVLLKIKLFFQKHPEIKIAHIPLQIFEARNEPHILNKTFEKDEEIVDIFKQKQKIFAHISSTFIRRALFTDTIFRFEVGRKYGEDLALIAKLVEKEKKFALVNNVFYRYRARNAGDSAMDSSRSDPATYIPNAEMLLQLAQMHEKDGEIDSWLQNIIAYDLGWKLRREKLPFATDANFYKTYLDLVYQLLQYVDEQVIRSIGHLRWFQKEALVFFKNTGKFPSATDSIGVPISSSSNTILENGEKRYLLSNIVSDIRVFKYRPELDSITIVGTIDHLFGPKDLAVTATDDDQVFTSTTIQEPARMKIIGLPIHNQFTYSFEIPLSSLRQSHLLKLSIHFNGTRLPLKIKFAGYLSKIGNNIKSNYVWAGIRLIRYDFDSAQFEIAENTIKNLARFELDILQKIESASKLASSRKRRILYLRKLALQSKCSEKVVNVFGDRPDKADDNAEVFYEYVAQEHPEWANFFVLSKESEDWDRLENAGFNLVEYGSEHHEELLIQAQNLISSHASLEVLRPFSKNFGYLRDAYHFNFIFLQHGVTKHDLSLWLRKIEKDIRLLMTVGEPEKAGFLDYGYEYSAQEIRVTGFPRFDRLHTGISSSKTKGNILIAPTWRNEVWNTNDSLDTKTQKVRATAFFKEWQTLLLSQNLEKLARQGHTISFLLHPLMRDIEDGFELPQYIEGIPYETRYVEILQKADMLVTDFSSIYFDIAYQSKPSIFFQFDAGNKNNKEGYFDFERDGFGPVFGTVDEVQAAISAVAENGFQLDEPYRTRAQRFFSFLDSNNSARVDRELSSLIENTLQVKKSLQLHYSEHDIDSLYREPIKRPSRFRRRLRRLKRILLNVLRLSRSKADRHGGS